MVSNVKLNKTYWLFFFFFFSLDFVGNSVYYLRTEGKHKSRVQFFCKLNINCVYTIYVFPFFAGNKRLCEQMKFGSNMYNRGWN